MLNIVTNDMLNIVTDNKLNIVTNDMLNIVTDDKLNIVTNDILNIVTNDMLKYKCPSPKEQILYDTLPFLTWWKASFISLFSLVTLWSS